MSSSDKKQVEYLVVDTSAFIQNAPLHEIAENLITCQDVLNEVTNKRQLRRLITLPYNLVVKDVFPENIKFVTDFSKKTGDYPSLSAVDIKVIALTYQLEKEKCGLKQLRTEPTLPRPTTESIVKEIDPDITGFFIPNEKGVFEKDNSDNKQLLKDEIQSTNTDLLDNNIKNTEITTTIETSQLEPINCGVDDSDNEVLIPVDPNISENSLSDSCEDEDDDDSWINPSNVHLARKQVNSQIIEEKYVKVACMTTDFAMQNVLKQINLNVSALDGRIIRQLRTYILRCYACFKTTSIMTKKFCPKCGNDTLKKVAISVNENGAMQIHINPRKPLSGRGKIYSLPRIKGGKHPNNPIIVEDQPIPDNKPSRLARTKTNALDDDYIAGFSPFVMRDVNSKSAQLCIRPNAEFKQWMKRNPNESRRRRK